MVKELKLRIQRPEEIAKYLRTKGANSLGEISFEDTYFKQPTGNVLKISQKNQNFYLNVLEAKDGKFKIIEDRNLTNPDVVKAQLSLQYGVKRILKGKRQLFQLQSYQITLNHIDDIGDFLIVTGEEPEKSFIEHDLGIENPEYITVSFDELK